MKKMANILVVMIITVCTVILAVSMYAMCTATGATTFFVGLGGFVGISIVIAAFALNISKIEKLFDEDEES